MIEDFCKLNEAPSDGTCLGEPPGGFCDVGCCCFFYLTGGFCVSGLLFLPTRLYPGFSGPWRPPLALRSTLATFACFTFSITVLPWELRFWVGVFYPDTFLTLHSFPTFWHIFVTQMQAGTPHPGSSSVTALKELSLLADTWSWTTHIVDKRRLAYQLCQWAVNHRVKTKLLNIFRLFKVSKIVIIFWLVQKSAK